KVFCRGDELATLSASRMLNNSFSASSFAHGSQPRGRSSRRHHGCLEGVGDELLEGVARNAEQLRSKCRAWLQRVGHANSLEESLYVADGTTTADDKVLELCVGHPAALQASVDH